jgi:hypothetical protein
MPSPDGFDASPLKQSSEHSDRVGGTINNENL